MRSLAPDVRRKSLAAFGAACWVLAHAASLEASKGPAVAADYLHTAEGVNPGDAIRVARLEALVKAGDAESAKPLIEQRLRASRHQARWLLLRAQIAAAGGNTRAARDDIAAALAETKQRLARSPHNAALITDLEAAERLASSLSKAADDPDPIASR